MKMQNNTVKEAKKTAKKINKAAVNFSDNLVDETLATGEQWQKLFVGAVKKGTKVMDKNQDLVFDTLEEVKVQYLKGQKRFWKLVSFGYPKTKLAKSAAKVAKKATAKVAAKANEAKATVTTVTKKVAKASTATAAKTVKTTTKKATATAKKVTTKAAVKSTPAKKTIAKSTTTKVVKADNLKVIEGIGPKIEGLLKDAGMKSYKDLATAPESKIQAVLDAAGPRFRMYKPATWTKQAALAAAGKMDELKALQAKLDGGRK